MVGADEMKYNARKLYETYYQEITDAEKDPAVVKGENADGKTYIVDKGEAAFVGGGGGRTTSTSSSLRMTAAGPVRGLTVK